MTDPSSPRISGGPSAFDSTWSLLVTGPLFPGPDNELKLSFKPKNGPSGGRVKFTIKPHPAFLNLRPTVRETDVNGELTLKGLKVAKGYPSAPLTVDIGPGQTRLTTLLTIQAEVNQMTAENLSPVNNPALKVPQGYTAYDLSLLILSRAQPYEGGITFLKDKALPNLRPSTRLVRKGRLAVKGLMVAGPSSITGRLDSGAMVTTNILTPGNSPKPNLTPQPLNLDPTGSAKEDPNNDPNKDHSYLANQIMTFLTPTNDGKPDPLFKAVHLGLERLSQTLKDKLSPLGQWRSRASLDADGEFIGGADYLYPFLDQTSWLLFGQGGLSLSNKGRLLAHLGAGQRFFPDENTALGYNAFLDGDLKRRHYRFGLGLEFWRPSLKLAANLYEGLGPWRKSVDYPHWPVLEKAASGWDLRAEVRPTFAPSLAFLGSLEKWRGQTGYFSPDRKSNSLAYSYGLSWSPWPLMTAAVTQTRAQGQKVQTNFGVNFNFRPGVLEEKRANFTNPSLLRHEFVDRDYSMPIVYKGQNLHRIHLITAFGAGLYLFKVTDGFGRVVKNQGVKVGVKDPTVTILDPGTLLPRNVFQTSSEGEYLVLYESPTGNDTPTHHATSEGQGSFNVTPKSAVGPIPPTPPIPPEPPEPPVDPVYAVTLKQSQSPNFIFALTNEKGEPIPNHKVSGQVQESQVSLYAFATTNPTSEFITDQDGLFGLSLSPILGFPTANLALTPEGGLERVFPLPLPHVLALAAAPLSLETGTPALVNFAFTFNGAPLTSGTLVELIGPNGAFTNLPNGPVPGGDLGVLTIPDLTANYAGSLIVSGQVRGFNAGQVTFTVTDPVVTETLTLTATPTVLNYGAKTTLTLTILKNGTLLAAGSPVTVIPGANLTVPQSAYVLTAAGTLVLENVVGQSLGATNIAVQSGALVSPPAALNVVASGHLTLRTLTPSLEFLAPSEVILVAELNGEPLPTGVNVALDVAPGLKNFPPTAVTEANGRLTFNRVIAEKPGPLNVAIQALGLFSNPVSLDVTSDPGELSLTAAPTSLEYLAPTETVFTFRYKGQPLPAGLMVSLTSPDDTLGGLITAATQEGGRVIVPAAEALDPIGPLLAQGTVVGLNGSPTTTLTSYWVDSKLLVNFDLSPPASFDASPVPPGYPGFIYSCQLYRITLTLTYLSQPVANVPVTVYGYKLGASGQNSVTNAYGQVTSQIFFDLDDFPAYQSPNYDFTIGSLTVTRPGPIPTNFSSCGP
jgi:hypothetical protein